MSRERLSAPELRLTQQETQDLIAALHRTEDVRVKRRIIGILLLGQGCGLAGAAEEAELAPNTLIHWASRYILTRSPQALVTIKTRRGRAQVTHATLLDLLRESPRRFGYPYDAWTAKLVRTHLASKAKLVVPILVIERLLANTPVPEADAPGADVDPSRSRKTW